MPNIASAELHPTRKPAGLVTVDGRTFPLRSARIEARAEGGLAASTLIQEYANPHAEPLEVLYTMPLPADGAVAGYAFTIGERTVTGTIERRDQAQADYRRALLEGRTAGLLEQERADSFTQSLGNVPPGAAVTVRIDVHHPLRFLPASAGLAPRWEWRFPTVAGVRYQGAPGRVADAERLDAPRADGERTPVRIAAELAIDGGRTLSVGPAPLDRDVVLTWEAASRETEARLVEGRGLEGDAGRYALLTITPPAAPRETLARDLTVLIDASGSMSGRPLEAAKAVAAALVDSLTAGDRFQILAFASSVRDLTDGIVPASSEATWIARERLDRLSAGGATEMVAALHAALAPIREGAQRQVVLLTDGYIGFESEVVSQILERLPEGSRLHVAGIGAAPNRALTRAAARAGRGIEVLIGLEDDPKEAAERLVRGTAAPVLTGVRVSGSGVEAIAPERPRDVFAGDPLRVLVALRPGGGTVIVTARLAGPSAPWVRKFDVPSMAAPSKSAPPLGAFYGRERVEDLEMRLARGGREMTVVSAIEAAGLEHRIVTRRTSLVAISEDPAVDPRDPRRRERLAAEMPAGVSAEGVGLSRAREEASFSSFRLRLMSLSDEAIRAADEASPPASPLGRIGGDVSTGFEGRLVRLDGSTVVIEVDVAGEPLVVPEGGHDATIVWSEGDDEEVRFDARLGARPGPYAEGLTVAVGLVRRTARPHAGRPVRVVWFGEDGGRVEVRLA